MKTYTAVWDDEFPDPERLRLQNAITVVGEWLRIRESEFARVQVTVRPSEVFEVEDCAADCAELVKLNADWPDAVIVGLLESLAAANPKLPPNVRITLDAAWYHHLDSTPQAFSEAGRDAGRKIIRQLNSAQSVEGY
jgi:hypothetical protein